MSRLARSNLTVHTNQAALAAQRKRELGHIHEGKKVLGWSDDDYHFHLRNLTDKASAADLDAAGRAKVLAHMDKLGYRPKARPFKPFGQAEKIEWLWKKVGEHGGLRDASPAALRAFVHRTTDIDDVQFLPTIEASKVIEALKAMLDRAKRAQGGTHA